jgi:signal transduction histidine kinase
MRPDESDPVAGAFGGPDLAVGYFRFLQRLDSQHLRDLADMERATRDRIRAELHDSVQHQLSVLQGLLGETRADATAEPVRGHLDRMAVVLQDVVHRLREVIDGIYPSALTQSGLRGAIESLMWSSPVTLDMDATAPRLPDPVEYAVFLIVSEAVGNARRHADPSRIDIRISEADGAVVVDVADDGVGIGPVGVDPAEEGVGIRSMRARAAALGGTLTVNPGPDGSGTVIRARIPCAS